MRKCLSLGLTVVLFACSGQQANQPFVLPEPHANNAVALATLDDGEEVIYSFYGLKSGKTHADVSQSAFRCPLAERRCEAIAPPPVDEGRLASVAVFLHDRIFIFGGYTVAADGAEVSTPEVFAFNPETNAYQRRADMPTPVDDAVAFAYANQYIYLVSGWHNDGNVSTVQVFDTWEDRWFEATAYPGAPVFGHAGGSVDGKFVIADGVAVVGVKNGRRQFGEVSEVWIGEINPDDPSVISWRAAPPHPFGPLYRMAAEGDPENNRILFAGGGDNPYNYNGVGYDGVPAKPSDVVFAFDLETEEWRDIGRMPAPRMDHRGLMIGADSAYIAGGMDADLNVSNEVLEFEIRASGQ